jgi:hypothetical protein
MVSTKNGTHLTTTVSKEQQASKKHALDSAQKKDNVWMDEKETDSEYDSDSYSDGGMSDDSSAYTYSSGESGSDSDDENSLSYEEIFSKPLVAAPAMPRSVSQPALVNMNPLITKRELNIRRVGSSPFLRPMAGARLNMLERMRNAEYVFGGSNLVLPTPPAAAPKPVQNVTKPGECEPFKAANSRIVVDPQIHFINLLKKKGTVARHFPALELECFFLEITQENINGYDLKKAAAVRDQDVNALRNMHGAGESLQVCNRFGESIVHAACRRGATPVLQFLTQEAGVSLKVIDDYGRTPMHDACWTNKPVFELVEVLLEVCPELLFVADKRGYSPLQYVRREFWGVWCRFLDANEHRLTAGDLESKCRI